VRHPGMKVIHVPDQGHAPLLDDAPTTIAAIGSFVAACDGASPGPSPTFPTGTAERRFCGSPGDETQVKSMLHCRESFVV
jgi:hypothetical protein